MELILGPVVGAVMHNKAKIWIFWHQDKDEPRPVFKLYKDENCTEEIRSRRFTVISDSVHEFEDKQAVAGIVKIPYQPTDKKYFFKIHPFSTVYSLRPFPRVNNKIDSLSFALTSCSRPLFTKSDETNFTPMWQALGEQMHKHDCRFHIQAGDQVYADQDQYNAFEMSLKEASAAKRLWYYRQLYIKSWRLPEVRQVMEAFPQYMIWDDHEIANGWGSNREHTQDPKYRAVFQAARQAYVEFQHSHNPDSFRKGELYYAFHYGPVAFLVMDIRGHRDYGMYLDHKGEDNIYPLAGKEQWEDIEDWFHSRNVKKSKMLFVVTSVPVVHLSRGLAAMGFLKNDIRDQWSTKFNKNERRKLLKLMYDVWMEKERKPAFILGGDVHIGTLAIVIENKTNKVIHQITSSPISHDPPYFLDFFLSKWSGDFDFHLEEGEKRPVHGHIYKRYRRKNFAIINIKFKDEQPEVSVEMFEHNKQQPDVVNFNEIDIKAS